MVAAESDEMTLPAVVKARRFPSHQSAFPTLYPERSAVSEAKQRGVEGPLRSSPHAGCPILTSCFSTLEPALSEAEGVGFHGSVEQRLLHCFCFWVAQRFTAAVSACFERGF